MSLGNEMNFSSQFSWKSFIQFGYGNITIDCPPCECNTNGSSDTFCDTDNGQCSCKMGVEGLKCDICMDSYFGLSTDGCEGEFENFLCYFIKSEHPNIVEACITINRRRTHQKAFQSVLQSVTDFNYSLP